VTAPRWEVADVIRMVGCRFLESLTRAQQKVLSAIVRCRTAALGGHRDQCVGCGYQEIKFHSCRNRHCPKCQINAREKWLQKRRQELLPIPYFHIVFSVPHQLIPLMWQNKKLLFSLLFQATGSTLLEVAADPKRLGAEIGFLCILHTWGQTMNRHPHIHCVVPGGGLSLDHTRWIPAHPRFFLPVKVLSSVFRDKFLDGLKQAHLSNQLRFFGDCEELSDSQTFAAFVDELSKMDWVVYSKPPFGGAEHVLQYLARYTHRVAISNHRIVSVDESQVTFLWKDYANDNKQRSMTLTCEKFLQRFLQHTLPKGLPRIRYFGWLANRRRGELLPICRTLLHQDPNPPEILDDPQAPHCPHCHSKMCIIEHLTAAQILQATYRMEYALNTS
jgi:hypothetical protein